MKDFDISHEEYMEKTTFCCINGDECGKCSCKNCELAWKQYVKNSIEILEDYTCFDNDIEICGLPFKVNYSNTIVMHPVISDLLCVFGGTNDNEYVKYDYEFEIPVSDYPMWKKMKIYNALSTPDYFMYRKDSPLIVVYPHVVYGIAPVIKDGV